MEEVVAVAAGTLVGMGCTGELSAANRRELPLAAMGHVELPVAMDAIEPALAGALPSTQLRSPES